MEIRMLQRPFCQICGGKGELLYANLMDRLFGVPGTWSLRLCVNNACGLCWLDPAPIEEDVHLLYETYHTHGLGNAGQKKIAGLRAFFYNSYLALSWIPSTLLGLRKARRQMLRMFLDDLKPGKLLDVGCGGGQFMHQMHNLGWTVTGLDFDGKAVENAKIRYGSALTFLHTDLPGAKFPDNFFDAVTMNHVIEHVPDPVALLKEARRILKVGGRLIATTPNIQSFGHEKFRDCWRGLETPRHLQIFSPDALRQCARMASFDDVQVATSAANADTIIGGSLSIQEAKSKDDCFSATKVKIRLLRGLRSLLLQYWESWLLRCNPKCGEEIFLIGHK
jgi:ubiquinone/menaquinone biosynthesis C-methylase UbiE